MHAGVRCCRYATLNPGPIKDLGATDRRMWLAYCDLGRSSAKVVSGPTRHAT